MSYQLELSHVHEPSFLLSAVFRAYGGVPPGWFDSFELAGPSLVENIDPTSLFASHTGKPSNLEKSPLPGPQQP